MAIVETIAVYHFYQNQLPASVGGLSIPASCIIIRARSMYKLCILSYKYILWRH